MQHPRTIKADALLLATAQAPAAKPTTGRLAAVCGKRTWAHQPSPQSATNTHTTVAHAFTRPMVRSAVTDLRRPGVERSNTCDIARQPSSARSERTLHDARAGCLTTWR